MQLYLGSVDYAGLRQQERLYGAALRAAERVADTAGMPTAAAWSQIEAEARRRGTIRPLPGQHI